MNTMNRLIVAGARTALAAALAPALLAQAPQTGVRSGTTDLSAPPPNATTADQQNPVSKVNKASSLVGMEVRNQQNEKLGEIKDLAIDLPSGKIAYAVLGVGGFLGIGDKYVAVPPSAFSVSADQTTLVLNADKAKIQNAPSFAKNSWPEVNSPTWRTESDYWRPAGTAQGTLGQSTSSSGTSSSATETPPANRALTGNPGVSQSTRESSVPEHSSVVDRNTFHGRITEISPETRTVTVQGPSGTRQFKFTDRPTLTLKENRNPHLTDFKVGYPVVVGYHESDGTYLADSLSRADTPEVR
jgi:sporulation protein YlmC with PRC-barrel domain